jgi:phosphoribosylanthranilate isomerase
LTKIKICGISDTATAGVAARAGADFIGVVLAESSRRVTPERAGEIAAAVGEYPVEVVGVFVDAPAEEVNRLSGSCGLDRVQLSGNESWEYCRQIEKPLIKAVHVPPAGSAGELLKYLEEGSAMLSGRSPVFLLDTFDENQYGGTGRTFNWEVAERAAAEYSVIVAGGLNPENVGRVIAGLRPWGVDVSSGVETGGVKDINRILAFISSARMVK